MEEVVDVQFGLEMYFHICVPRLGEDFQVLRRLDFFCDAISFCTIDFNKDQLIGVAI